LSKERRAEHISLLKKVGLSEEEARVYLVSLELGAEAASVIADRVKLKRGQTYNLLKSLIQRGLIQEFERSGTKHFVASSPETVLSLIDRKDEELQRKRSELLSALPELETVRTKIASPPKIRFFQGLEGVKEVLTEIISVGNSEIAAFLDLEKRHLQLGPDASEFIDSFAAERIERNIWLYGIVPQDSLAREDKRRGASGPIMRREFRTLPGYNPTAEIYIYRGCISIVSTWKQKIGLTIEDESIFNTYLELHRSLWALLPVTEEVRQAARILTPE